MESTPRPGGRTGRSSPANRVLEDGAPPLRGGAGASAVHGGVSASYSPPGLGVGDSVTGRHRGSSSCCTRWSPEAGRGCRRPPSAGGRRPVGGHTDPSAVRTAALGAGPAVRRRPLHHHPRDRRDTSLLAERGCAVHDRPGLRLRTLPDVSAYAQVAGIELRLDATEIQGGCARLSGRWRWPWAAV